MYILDEFTPVHAHREHNLFNHCMQRIGWPLQSASFSRTHAPWARLHATLIGWSAGATSKVMNAYAVGAGHR